MVLKSSYVIRVWLAGRAIAASGASEIGRGAVFILLNPEV